MFPVIQREVAWPSFHMIKQCPFMGPCALDTILGVSETNVRQVGWAGVGGSAQQVLFSMDR